MSNNTEGIAVAFSNPGSPIRRQMLDGSFRIFLAEALILPTGLITAAFLTRYLGPSDYGIFTLACVVVLWIEFFVTCAFSRAAIKLIGDAEDWQPWGSTLVRFYFLAGTFAALLLWLGSDQLARVLGEPTLAGYLRLFALDIPIYSLATAHRDILIGLRHYRARALAGAARWMTRLVLIVVLIWAGLSVRGAVWAMIGASLFDMITSRYYVRPPLWRRFPVRLGHLWDYAVPLLVSGVALRVFDKLDLFMLKVLGASAAMVGYYGAAQNLTIVPGLIGTALAPVLLSALTHTRRGGDAALARELARDAIRFTICLLPFAALIAASSPEIATLLMGQTFAPAGPFLAILIFAGFGRLVLSVCLSILIAAERPRWVLLLTAPVVPLATASYVAAIRTGGPRSAALTTSVLCALLTVVALAAVYFAWGVKPSSACIARTALLSLAVYAAALAWPATGIMLLIKLGVIGGLLPIAYFLCGEFERDEISRLTALFWPAASTTGERANSPVAPSSPSVLCEISSRTHPISPLSS
ncbi:MAG: oligosaccharide flippase family protein [Acidobacteriaceae bacterium]|nr:oligosaccharide flippase family protein [Acidobacteriaceae bacterium]